MRVGRIGYINCYPIYSAIDRGLIPLDGCKMVTGTPSELNDLLRVGELGVSVVSAIEYARHADLYHILSDVAISSDGPVRSVALFSHRPVEELSGRTVLLSQSSRTSILLLDLLCRELWGIEPTFGDVRAEAPDLQGLSLLPHDAVLVIGDAALHLRAAGSYEYRYDLGEVWKEWTGLPFVFAVWAARREQPRTEVEKVHNVLLKARDWGLENLETLADEASAGTGIDRNTCFEYLSGLDYGLDYRRLEGLTSFFRRLVARKMVAEGTLSILSVA